MKRYGFYRRRSPVVSLFLRLVFLLTISVLLFILLTEVMMRPMFMGVAETEAIRLANRAIYEAVKEQAPFFSYDDLITYRENSQGEIVMLLVNHSQVNRLIAQITMSLQDTFDEVSEQGMALPLAQLLGIQILAGFGPRLQVKILPLGIAEATVIHDEFESVGINQTRHRIYLEFKPSIRILVPFRDEVVQVKAQVPVTEVTIMGRVPEVYLNLEGGLLGAATP